MTPARFASRHAKALKIRQILSDFSGHERLQGSRCLDIGCGTGEIARHLASLFTWTVGVDRSVDLILEGHRASSGLDLLQADGVRLPFSEASFDIVICAQVYEHMAQAEKLPAEVERVLRPGGLCFFSGPNRLWPVEPHYRLPFLHWLPARLADAYLRASGRGRAFSVRPFSVWSLRRLWRRFARYDYTIKMLLQPERFGLSAPMLRYSRWLPGFVFRVLYSLLPNYNWVLVKSDAISDRGGGCGTSGNS